jgi:hypothetical protein
MDWVKATAALGPLSGAARLLHTEESRRAGSGTQHERWAVRALKRAHLQVRSRRVSKQRAGSHAPAQSHTTTGYGPQRRPRTPPGSQGLASEHEHACSHAHPPAHNTIRLPVARINVQRAVDGKGDEVCACELHDRPVGDERKRDILRGFRAIRPCSRAVTWWRSGREPAARTMLKRRETASAAPTRCGSPCGSEEGVVH